VPLLWSRCVECACPPASRVLQAECLRSLGRCVVCGGVQVVMESQRMEKLAADYECWRQWRSEPGLGSGRWKRRSATGQLACLVLAGAAGSRGA